MRPRLRHCSLLLLVLLSLATASCGKNDGGSKPASAHPKLPKGVAWEPGNRHCPSTILEEHEKDYSLTLQFSLEQDELHTIQELRIVGPAPDFALLASMKPVDGSVGKEQRFRLLKAELPGELDHLLVIVRCKQHGAYGVAQGFFKVR